MSDRKHLPATQLRSLRRALLRWYDQHRRDLPWRRDHHPYRVWVSEIMLQQTRVTAVLDHYARFMLRFPTVQSLARAREASVLATWSGLGYYHRARRLHQAAKIIARERLGEFPSTAQDWLQLPGIGRYTAAAIASIAFGEPVAVVDGNVERVLQRLFGWKRRSSELVLLAPIDAHQKTTQLAYREETAAERRDEFSPGCKPRVRVAKEAEPRSGGTPFRNDDRETAWQRAQTLLDRNRPGDFNQAMMELGATVCTPRAPKCPLCPLRSFCQSRGADEPLVATARKRRESHYALALDRGSVLLVRRPADSSLMAGMWELPTLAAENINGDDPLARLRHSITDTDYRVAVYAVRPSQLQDSATDAEWFTMSQWERLPLTGLARKILGRAGLQACVKLPNEAPRRKRL